MSSAEQRSNVELETEGEVDFGRYWRAIAQRWWLLAIGVVLGALIGFLFSLHGGQQYKATAQLYLGQPLAPDSASPVTTPPTTLGLVTAFVTSEDTIRKAAALARADRHESSGCVRLQDAPGLARWLFRGQVPRPSGAAEQQVDLPEPVPVYLAYFTALPSRDGIVFQRDVYAATAAALDPRRNRITPAK